jgi:hypothetical protein
MELFTSVGQVCLFVYLFIYLMALWAGAKKPYKLTRL